MFVQKFKFILMKMHKNCMLPPCRTAPFGTKSFVGWGFAPDATGGNLHRSPRPPSWLGGGAPGKGKEGGEGVPECPNIELASLISRADKITSLFITLLHWPSSVQQRRPTVHANVVYNSVK